MKIKLSSKVIIEMDGLNEEHCIMIEVFKGVIEIGNPFLRYKLE